MKRLLTIEWYKLKYHGPFWIFTGLHLLILLVIFFSGKLFLDLLSFKGESIDTIADPSRLPIFEFPDVWHNIAYIAGFLKIILAIYVIISICNEISYGTLRQNIMNGMSRTEFLVSKLFLILLLSITSTLFLLITGLTLGFVYTSPVELHAVIKYSGFLPAYFLQINCYLLLALLLGLLLKRTGISMGLLILYTLIIEPVIILRIKDEWVENILPLKAINNMVHMPFKKYMFREIQDYVAIQDIIIVSAYIILYLFLISLVLKKRDL